MAVLIPDAIERPKRNAPTVVEAAIDGIFARVQEWLVKDDQPERTREQLKEVLQYGGQDGYAAAKELDTYHCWSVDSELVEILNGFSGYLCSSHRAAVRKWAKEVEPKPSHVLGQIVRGKWGNDFVQGEIVAINTEYATYTIRRPSDAPGCGAIIDWEAAQEPTP